MLSRNEPKRILLVRNDGLGDVVLTLPAMLAVRRHFPAAYIAALVTRVTAPLVDATRAVDDVIIDDHTESAGQLGSQLRTMRFDAALVFNTNTRNALAVWGAGVRQRVTWAYKPAGFLLGNSRVRVRRSHPPIHESQFAMKFAERLGATAAASDLSPCVDIDAATSERVATRIARELGNGGPLFGVHPGSKKSAYNWPQRHYEELIARLAERGRVMVTGSMGERTELERIRFRLDESLRARVGFYFDLSLLELVAAIRLQTALTASSTGPMHLAGLVDTPVVALFSPHPVHAPAKWAPLGTAQTILVAPLEPGEDPRIGRNRAEQVMGRIGVDEVVEANAQWAAHAAGQRRHAG